jgi:hypothetical protein
MCTTTDQRLDTMPNHNVWVGPICGATDLVEDAPTAVNGRFIGHRRRAFAEGADASPVWAPSPRGSDQAAESF